MMISCGAVFFSPAKFTGESLFPLAPSYVRFRQSKPISAAFVFATAERKSTSFYEILKAPMGATTGEIKTAYRRLARVCHPDVAEIDRKYSSADEFMRIHAAYATLSDPVKRAEYDRTFLRKQRTLFSTPRFPGYAGRNWETEQCW